MPGAARGAAVRGAAARSRRRPRSRLPDARLWRQLDPPQALPDSEELRLVLRLLAQRCLPLVLPGEGLPE